jgi:hypothetical protein
VTTIRETNSLFLENQLVTGLEIQPAPASFLKIKDARYAIGHIVRGIEPHIA